MELAWRLLTEDGTAAGGRKAAAEYEGAAAIAAEAEITGMTGSASLLELPAAVGGHPAVSVGKNAFRGNDRIVRVILPDSVRTVGTFAFYDCRRLEEADLGGGVREVLFGAFRSCPSLSLIRIRVENGDFSPVRDVLQDIDAAVTFRIALPDGEACLYFPSFVNGFEEDTMARAIHPVIEGCGMAYREIVTRKELGIRAYDRLFSRAAQDGVRTASETAFSRLLCPYRLSDTDREQYERWLSEHSERVLPMLVKDGAEERIRYLLDRRLAGRDAVTEGLSACAEARRTELSGLLMNYEAREFGTGRGTEFSLDLL